MEKDIVKYLESIYGKDIKIEEVGNRIKVYYKEDMVYHRLTKRANVEEIVELIEIERIYNNDIQNV